MRRNRGGSFNIIFVALLIGMLDMMANQAITGIVISTISVPHINPPPKSKEERRVPTSPVALFYQVEWTEGDPHDIDMYVRCETMIPGGQVITAIVNYKQLHNVWLRLSKDDQGKPTILNVEKVESISDIQKVPPSTVCVANVHLYNSHGGTLPVVGKIVAIDQKDHPVNEKNIGVVMFSLERPGQESTLLVSRWNEMGILDESYTQTYPHVETTYLATTPSSARRSE